MTSSSMLTLHYTMCILVCICSLQTMVIAYEPASIHLSYYVQEVRSGPNATAAAGIGQGNFSNNGWGSSFIFDHPLKEGPTTDSKLLGNDTGTAAVTTIRKIATGGIQLSAQHIFTAASEYNGSSLTLTGTFGFLLKDGSALYREALETSGDTGATHWGNPWQSQPCLPYMYTSGTSTFPNRIF